MTYTENFTEVVPGEPLRRVELNTRGVAKYSDFGPIDGYISETVQDRRSVSTRNSSADEIANVNYLTRSSKYNPYSKYNPQQG